MQFIYRPSYLRRLTVGRTFNFSGKSDELSGGKGGGGHIAL